MTMVEATGGDEVAKLPPPRGRQKIAPALQRLSDDLRRHCPADAIVSFRFDGRLHVDIDVRTLEQVALVEHMLPTGLNGTLENIRRGKSPLSFFHRITAEIDA
ncbi:MAG: hypothetical protein JWM38_1811 [Sphingomonas bacterium]|nr:hypothetical protein [Sphingomonas bacterium]MDB5718384.1 hypothetical protein [Sphingomonas bacterium]